MFLFFFKIEKYATIFAQEKGAISYLSIKFVSLNLWKYKIIY